MERVYTIPLRREYLKVPRWKRAKKAMKAIREFTMRHMKVDNPDNVKISNSINEIIWSRGGKKVIPKITVKMIKEDEIVHVLLPDEQLKKEEKPKKKEKKEEQKENKEVRESEAEVKKVTVEEENKNQNEVKENGREPSGSPGEQES